MNPGHAVAMRSIAVIGGAGGVGSSIAFNLIRSTRAYDVQVIDSRPNMITSHVMDLQDAAALGAGSRVRGAELHEASMADVVVLAASVPLRLNVSRTEFLAENAAVVRDLIASLDGWHGHLVMMTNPVDALGTWALTWSGLAPERVLGYCVNDSLRLRFGIASALAIEPSRVDAWVLGEHGDAGVPIFSRVRVDGERVTLSDEVRSAAEHYLRTWYGTHVALDSGRASTWSSGWGTAAFVDALFADEVSVMPASIALRGEYGISGVNLGMPVRVGQGATHGVEEWELTVDEQIALERAADVVRANASALE